MNRMSGLNRLLTRRDKHAQGDHSHKKPKQTAGFLHGLFPEEEMKAPGKDDDKKIQVLKLRLERVGINDYRERDINFALNAPYANGDPDKAWGILTLLKESDEGIIMNFDLSTKLLGAVNRDGVSCYLDSVLFAMFARLDSFEAILHNNFEDEPRKGLAMMLRVWVNFLRVGKLITINITKQLQLRLADCGWKEAATSSQQDASEAFSFITETLALPLLTLKMDIFHTGKEEESDDHKFVNERLLEVAVPEDPEDERLVTLEGCLETYFNNRIEVKRYLERRNTMKSVGSQWSINSGKGSASHIESVELDESQFSSPTSPGPQSLGPLKSLAGTSSTRGRAPSIIQEHFISEKHESLGLSSSIDEHDSLLGLQRSGSIRQVMMPAFQFFSLLPWYTDNKPSNDAQVAAHFSSTRPILGICLKRYSVLANGKAIRRNTHIDIPTEIGLPHFIQDDSMSEGGPAFGNFKLSLQSAVCHRGNSVNSGHYVSLVRSHEEDSDDPSGDKWMRLDDLAKERVASVDVQEFLRKESPYLLFYQVQPIDDEHRNSADSLKSTDDVGPPSYAVSESRDSGVAGLSLSYQDSLDTAESLGASHGVKKSQEGGERSSMTDERPQGITFIAPGVEIPQQPYNTPPNYPHYLAAYHGEPKPNNPNSRGRSTIGQPQDKKRLSRSLSRLAAKLAKEKVSDNATPGPPSDAVVPSATTSQQALKVSTATIPTPTQNEPTRLKKEKHNKRNNGHGGYLVKGQQMTEKPERECAVM